MRPGYFRLRRCPLIYHQKSGQKRGGLMEIIQKTCPGYPGSIVVPLYTTRKTEQMETVAAYFFEKHPLTNRDILGCFSDWPGGNFSKFFLCPSVCPAGAARYSVAGKNFLSYTETFFHHFQVGKSENFLILRYVAGWMPPGRKRGRHCEKYRPSFGAFCKRKLSGFSHHHFLLFLSKTVLTGTHFRYHPYLSL